MKIEDINESNINSLLLHISTDKNLYNSCTDTLILYLLYNYNTQHDIILSKIKILLLGKRNKKNKNLHEDRECDRGSDRDEASDEGRDDKKDRKRRRSKIRHTKAKHTNHTSDKEFNISFNSNKIINKIFKIILKIKNKEIEDSAIETSLSVLEEKSLVLRETVYYYFESIYLSCDEVSEYGIEVLKRILSVYKIEFDNKDVDSDNDSRCIDNRSADITNTTYINTNISKIKDTNVNPPFKISKTSQNPSEDGLIDITNMDFDLCKENNVFKLNLKKKGDRDVYIEKLYKLLTVILSGREYKGSIMFLMLILLVNKVEEKKSLRKLIKVFFMGVSDMLEVLRECYKGVGKYGIFILNRVIYECRTRNIKIKYKKMLKMVGFLEIRNKGVISGVDWKDLRLSDMRRVFGKFKKPGVFIDLCKKLIKRENDVKKIQKFKETVISVSEKKLSNYDYKRVNILKDFIDRKLEVCNGKLL
ncbi:hypothetical protein CWI38_0240p0020 [Hamiltosporidium tvaerminnensis]|uniref:Uncharacterized protein n=1 Tax=Hamiltosporidium tvaerminnensis TaxID=1176355 RepID=A0A4Q9M1P3_9MICR|nr:hypothetical protein CWI38_0240p0020 [Hamiltosporidium tvaerminnensis]